MMLCRCLESEDMQGYTPLIWAAREGKLRVGAAPVIVRRGVVALCAPAAAALPGVAAAALPGVAAAVLPGVAAAVLPGVATAASCETDMLVWR